MKLPTTLLYHLIIWPVNCLHLQEAAFLLPYNLVCYTHLHRSLNLWQAYTLKSGYISSVCTEQLQMVFKHLKKISCCHSALIPASIVFKGSTDLQGRLWDLGLSSCYCRMIALPACLLHHCSTKMSCWEEMQLILKTDLHSRLLWALKCWSLQQSAPWLLLTLLHELFKEQQCWNMSAITLGCQKALG